MKNQKKAYIYAITAVFFWSTVASAFKIGLRYNEVLPMLAGASLVSLISLLITGSIQGSFKRLKEIELRRLLLPLALGLINPWLYYLILFRAYDLLPAQIAQPLNYTWSLVMVLLSILIQKQKIKYYDILAVTACYAGVLIISNGGGKLGEIHSGGVLLALSTSILWAIYWILNTESQLDSVLKLTVGFVSGTMMIWVCCIITGKYPAMSWQSIASISYIGLFEMGLTFVVWLKALQLTEKTVRVTNLIFLSPFASFIFINLTLHEPIAPTSILGLVLIVAGIFYQHREGRGSN